MAPSESLILFQWFAVVGAIASLGVCVWRNNAAGTQDSASPAQPAATPDAPATDER